MISTCTCIPVLISESDPFLLTIFIFFFFLYFFFIYIFFFFFFFWGGGGGSKNGFGYLSCYNLCLDIYICCDIYVCCNIYVYFVNVKLFVKCEQSKFPLGNENESIEFN